jgi:alcohol dehydrogenase
MDFENQMLKNQTQMTESTVQEFDFQLRTRMVRGNNAIERLGPLASEMGARRVLVVSDPGIVEAGHVGHGIASLQKAGIDTLLFDGAQENPTTENVDAGLKFAQRFEPEMLVGLGGGSSMDCAKGINFLYSNGGEMKDYWGVGKALRPMLPMIAVPTTAGTGSEMQSFALISDAHTHVKMACGDVKASCRIAILDPLLTLTQPQQVTALTGVDAMSHALETFVTKKRNPISILFSKQSWRLIAGNFRRVLENPDDLEARAAMQLGAAYSGIAIENSMLGASHALANPVTATYGTAHGQAVGVMLPHVVRFNGQEHEAWYRELLETTADVPGCPDPKHGSQALAEFVTELVASAGLETNLGNCGVTNDQLGQMSENAARQWTGQFNPREVDRENLLQLYEQAL